MTYITEFGGRFLATHVTTMERRALRGCLLEIADPNDLAWEILAEGTVVTLRPRSYGAGPIAGWGTFRRLWQPQLQAIHAFVVELRMNLAGNLWWMGDEYGDDPNDLDAGNVVMFGPHLVITPLPLPVGPDAGWKDNRRRAREVLNLPAEGGGLPLVAPEPSDSALVAVGGFEAPTTEPPNWTEHPRSGDNNYWWRDG